MANFTRHVCPTLLGHTHGNRWAERCRAFQASIVATLVFACGSNGETGNGTSNLGGTTSQVGVGGAVSTGGVAGGATSGFGGTLTGGAAQTGGSSGSGGARTGVGGNLTGGAQQTGGNAATGGTRPTPTTTGGSSSPGGSVSTGGIAAYGWHSHRGWKLVERRRGCNRGLEDNGWIECCHYRRNGLCGGFIGYGPL